MKRSVSRLLRGGFLLLLVLVVILFVFRGTVGAAGPVSHSWVTTAHNPLGDVPAKKLHPPSVRAAPGVAVANPFALPCQCGEQCSCTPDNSCGCGGTGQLPTVGITAQRAEPPSTFRPDPAPSVVRTYTVAPATVRYGITSGGGACANGQCGAASSGTSNAFGGFFRRSR